MCLTTDLLGSSSRLQMFKSLEATSIALDGIPNSELYLRGAVGSAHSSDLQARYEKLSREST